MRFSIISLLAFTTLATSLSLPAVIPTTTTPATELAPRKLNSKSNSNPNTTPIPAIPSTCSATLHKKQPQGLTCGVKGGLVYPGHSPSVYAGVSEQTCIDLCLCVHNQDTCSTISFENGTCKLYKKKVNEMGVGSNGDQIFYQRACFISASPVQTAAANFHPQRMRRSVVDDYVIGALAI